MSNTTKSKRLTDKNVTTGALPVPNPTCIDDILGRRYFMYKEKDEKEYQANLEKLNLAELQHHAIEIANIIPSADRRDQLINKLIKVYLERKYKFVAVAQKSIEPLPEPSEAVMEILRRGR